jgi:hypothetical protein
LSRPNAVVPDRSLCHQRADVPLVVGAERLLQRAERRPQERLGLRPLPHLFVEQREARTYPRRHRVIRRERGIHDRDGALE